MKLSFITSRASDHKEKFDAISRSQAVIEFTLGGVIVDANPNIPKCYGL